VLGEIFPCPECDDYDREQRVERFAGLPAAFKDWTFENLEVHEGIEPVVKYAKFYAKGQLDAKWFVMGGTVGWAKTHIGVSILNARKANPSWGQANGKYVSCPQFLEELRQGYDNNTYQHTLWMYQEVRLLLLDDVGTEYRKRAGGISWADEKLYLLLNHRLINRLETIITTNIPVEDMDVRLADRILDDRPGMSAVFIKSLPSYRTGVKRG
jgi:DNA replication protein DnaC